MFMFCSAFIWTVLLLAAGYATEACEAPGSCSASVGRYLYNVIVVIWLIQ